MNEQIDITVAIPVYNADIYIADTVRSVLEQDFTGTYEIIIVDDHGTDRSMELVSELQRTHPRGGLIRVIRPEHNIGQGKGRAMALQQAKGRYFFMMDADDLIVSQTLSHLYGLQQKYDVDFVWGSYAFGLEPSQCFMFEDAVLKDNYSIQTYWFGHYLRAIWNILFKTNFLKTCQFAIDDESPKLGEDVYLALQVVQKAQKAVFSSRVSYLYRRYSNSVAGQAFKKENRKEWDIWVRLTECYMQPMVWPTATQGEVVCQAEKLKHTVWFSITFIEAILSAKDWCVNKEMKPYIRKLKTFPIPGHAFLVMKRILFLPSYRLKAMMLYGLCHLPIWALVRYLKRRHKRLSNEFASYDGSRPDWAQTMLAYYSQDIR